MEPGDENAVAKDFRNQDWETISEKQYEEEVKELLGDAASEKFEFNKVSQ
ncbi:MAG: hypothetical protein IJH65_08920 [Methanobrevibacter sp.]|nr:hypothetical protein [Methanobrevibacter sp.]